LKKNLLSAMLLVCLMALSISTLPSRAASKPIIVVHAKGALEPGYSLEAIMNNITEVDWVLVTGELTATDLAGATMLILVQVDAQLNYTDTELAAITSWFSAGGKAIWVAGDSDFGTDRFRIPSSNSVLEAIGSVLRFEDCETVDPVSNAGFDYRVLGVSENCDPEVNFLVAGVTKALFHGPGLIIGYYGGAYHKLEEEKPDNVFIVMTSSESGTVAEFNEPAAELHEIGDVGTFPMMVIEVDYTKKNIIIATADAPFDHYMGMYMPELRGPKYYQRYMVDNPQQGARLFKNIISYVLYYAPKMLEQHNQIVSMQSQVNTLQGQVTTLQEQISDLETEVAGLQGTVSMWQGAAGALLVVGLVIGAVIVYFMKHK